MRIALHHTGDVGFRAGRILLGDRRVSRIGLIGRTPTESHSGRVEKASELADYDLVVTDDAEPLPTIERAMAANISCVVWVEPEMDTLQPESGSVLLTGANLGSGIAPCLASHEVAQATQAVTVIVAWTEPGTPLRSGEPLAFPDPIGGRWGRRHRSGDHTQFVAPVSGDWGGAVTKVTTRANGSSVTRIVGVADLAAHMEALALAAGALAVGADAYRAGVVRPVDADTVYLAEALGAGLDVASYTLEGG